MQLGREQKAAIATPTYHDPSTKEGASGQYDSLAPHHLTRTYIARNDTELMYQDLLHVNTASHFIAIMSTVSN